MADKKQLKILKQGVAAWNAWREENPDAKIDLRGAKLSRMDLSGANFCKANICDTDFRDSILVKVDFSYAKLGKMIIGIDKKGAITEVTNFSYSDLRYSTFNYSAIEIKNPFKYDLTSVKIIAHEIAGISDKDLYTKENRIIHTTNINIIHIKNIDPFEGAALDYTSWKGSRIPQYFYFYLRSNFFSDDKLCELFMNIGGQDISLKGKSLKNTLLVNFDLRGVDLRETNLVQANLSGAEITGAKLYGSARDNWIIDGIRCDYVYWDETGKERTPPDRDFRPGEFEELYKQLPTFEYIFEQGFTPLDPLVMDRVVQAINEQHKEFKLDLINFDKRGQPHATFTVCQLDFVDTAREQVSAVYEANRVQPENQDQLMAAFMGLIENQSKSLDIIKQLGGSNMGDIYNISGGQVGAVGKSAISTGNTFQQIVNDLSRLHQEMERSASTPDQQAAAQDVAKAEQAARQKDEPTMRQHLKSAGQWALDCAQKIGTEVATEYLKKITTGG
ncbi:MAG: pentapeptide repeat-containing protein [Candidatus Electrothrix sp. AX5]|nr:pentapeptide repeat-containing protein [Candidatus Electrothrix sp. AX5]